MTKERYLEMCGMTGEEPDPARMPLDFDDFPPNIQELFTIVNMMPDRWDGMSGSYLGKDLTLIPYLFDLYEVESPKMSLYIVNLIIAENSRLYNEKLKRKTDAKKKRK